MDENVSNPYPAYEVKQEPLLSVRLLRYSFHLLLFVLAFFTTTLAGVQWLNRDPFELSNFYLGLPYSISLLAVLSAHEFGHYFAARYYGVSTTLPYFIPIPPFLLNPFGTMGAVIRIRSPLTSKKSLFDIGIAGPLAGLAVTLAVLLYGFLTLPGKEFLYSIHPEYRHMEKIPEYGLTFGSSLLFWGLSHLFAAHNFMPPMNEVYHYPFLCVGWFGLFVTALNLIPVGQLDGGHILYALIGKGQGRIARVFFAALILIGLSSLLPFLGWKVQPGTVGWLVWAAVLFFIIKIDHPEIPDDTELGPSRKFLGWFTFAVFVASFPPVPLFEISPT
ncbi:MAG: site-2 protease family protein [Bacteroidota bacterium]|jgi:membrane-associated protease RseP (regulator of RpoE activity)